MPDTSFTFSVPPPARSRLSIARDRDGVVFYFPSPRPNAWWRFWQWALLGWRWEAIEDKDA